MVYYCGTKNGDVLKWFKRPHSKCDRPGNRCEGSNPSISAIKKGTGHAPVPFLFAENIVGFGPVRARTSMRKSGGLSNSEWSEGDRTRSRGRSLRAKRSRRSNPSISILLFSMKALSFSHTKHSKCFGKRACRNM